MAVMENSAAENSQREEEENDSGNSPLSSRTRTKDSGIRVRNGRIYDFENVKTCHRCRQKTRDFAAFCKKPKNKKPSPLTFCHICLFNKYGENADEVGKSEGWICPKCRGVCNCSFCMKKKGYEPAGMLAHTAKNLLFLTRVRQLQKEAVIRKTSVMSRMMLSQMKRDLQRNKRRGQKD